MRLTIFCAATAATLLLAPSITMAQSTGNADTATGASVKMKGPPNANGATSGEVAQPDQTTSGRSESSGTNMKGPPNADGAPGARGSGGSQQ
jgi:hypothetical protein